MSVTTTMKFGRTMRAVGFLKPLAITEPDSLLDIELPIPQPGPQDLLVAVQAIAVNPKDVKVRATYLPSPGACKVMGWDVAGCVAAAGAAVTLFKPGDEVFYAGAIDRQGGNAQFHVVDERIVALKPPALDMAAAAALPLTSITAYEALFHRLEVCRPVPGAAPAIVIIGGAGGVGSIAIQLLRAKTDLTIIASASREVSARHALAMGSHHIVDHSRPMAPQIEALGLGLPGFVFCLAKTDAHLPDIARFIAPQGRLVLVDDPETLDVRLLKAKSASIHWEAMFARSLYGTPDMIEQHRLLNDVAALVQGGTLVSTITENFGAINAANLKRAHALVESGLGFGKVVLAGWD